MNWTRQALVAAILLLGAVALRAANWAEPAAALASDITAVIGTNSASLTVRNQSSLSTEDVTEIRRLLESELRRRGALLLQTGGIQVEVRLSQNVQGLLWIAEIRQGNDVRVIMREVTRPKDTASAQMQARVSIRQELLFAQAQPILDVAAVGVAGSGSTQLAVLDAEKLALYDASGSTARPAVSFPLTAARPWPRDLRGRLVPARDHLLDAYLPGVFCTATATTPIALPCRESDDPWPLTAPTAAPQRAFFGAARNFFTGALSPGIGSQHNVEPFYSAAAVPRGSETVWLMAGVDGRVRLVDGGNEAPLPAVDWGSDIAALAGPCGTFVLATGAGDRGAPDTLQVFEIGNHEAMATSPAVEFGGPITALWTAADGNSATAIVHNLQTDNYEALRITLACSR